MTEQQRQNFSSNLSRIMLENFISPADLAKACGVNLQAVYMWKRGKQFPRIQHLRKLCNRLNVHVTDLIN